jgi:hypothetical protein
LIWAVAPLDGWMDGWMDGQGWVLSPLLFNTVLDSTLQAMDMPGGIILNVTSRLEDLDHADVTCLLSHTLMT